ncbi:MAG: glycosyltransferase family 4 protein, partial [Candidatus Lutacidiplasmatales archaeon]
AAEFVVGSLADAVRPGSRPVKFVLAGIGTESLPVGAATNVVGLGPVDDLANLLFACHIGIAPLRSGSGISGKVADYLLHGLVTVATSIAAVGLPPCPTLVVTEPEGFAGVISDLISRTPDLRPGRENPIDPAVQEGLCGRGPVDAFARDIESLARTRVGSASASPP